MSKNQLKAGDLLNVVKDKFREVKDVNMILIQVPTLDASMSLGEVMDGEIHFIEKADFHSTLTEFGVNVGHYVLRSEKVEQIATPPDNPEILRINGEYDIPKKEGVISRDILNAPYLDVTVAKSIATQLNEVELEKLENLMSLVEKARENMTDVVKNQRV